MKKLFSSLDPFELQAVRSELDALCIPYMVKNEYAGGAIGELPWQEAQQELWLLDEAWFNRASEVVDALTKAKRNTSAAFLTDWVCAGCGEENGSAFDSCWQCAKSSNC